MSEKAELGAQISRGEQAKEVLNNPVYQHAFLEMKAEILNRFEATTHKGTDERYQAWLELKALNELESKMKDVMQTGQLAKTRLADLLSNAKFWK